jgi:hypothetical protein
VLSPLLGLLLLFSSGARSEIVMALSNWVGRVGSGFEMELMRLFEEQEG